MGNVRPDPLSRAQTYFHGIRNVPAGTDFSAQQKESVRVLADVINSRESGTNGESRLVLSALLTIVRADVIERPKKSEIVIEKNSDAFASLHLRWAKEVFRLPLLESPVFYTLDVYFEGEPHSGLALTVDDKAAFFVGNTIDGEPTLHSDPTEVFWVTTNTHAAYFNPYVLLAEQD